MSDDIVLVEYDSRWPTLFEAEAARVRAALGDDWVMAVEHVGSTAIPGLAAKPVIDILVGVRSLAARAHAVPVLEAMAYAFWHDNPARDRLFFVKGLPPHGPRTHHVHVVEPNAGELFRDTLRFRDFLRAHPEEVRRYEALKRDLAARFASDREAYTDAKGDYILSVLEKARAEQEV